MLTPVGVLSEFKLDVRSLDALPVI